MKYLLLIALLFPIVGNSQNDTGKCKFKNYHYYYSGSHFNNPFSGRYVWGEEDMCLDHRPTKKEVRENMRSFLGSIMDTPAYKNIRITIEETNDPCPQCNIKKSTE